MKSRRNAKKTEIKEACLPVRGRETVNENHHHITTKGEGGARICRLFRPAVDANREDIAGRDTRVYLVVMFAD